MQAESARLIADLVSGVHFGIIDMMPGWNIQLASQKLLFFTKPDTFATTLSDIYDILDSRFDAKTSLQPDFISFMLKILESLYSPVEISYNLQSNALHGSSVMEDISLQNSIQYITPILKLWESRSPDAARRVLDEIKVEDLAVNKGDNLFIEWATRWESKNGIDPYSTLENYTNCFKELYTPDNYYISLFQAWDAGRTKTQFFNDYGLHSERCRRIGSLGGTTNPAIAVMGEDDLDGIGNIRGDSAINMIKAAGNKWHQQRESIAKQQDFLEESDEWGASAFTEIVVTDAMLAMRPVYLLRGLGRVAYQIRPDWHLDEEKLIRTAVGVYESLSERVSAFDNILLDSADELYTKLSDERRGKPNTHFKIACTSGIALNVVKALNAGYHPDYPDAIKERMFTNMTLVFDVSQMVASNLAIENGISEYEIRTGSCVDDGEGGSAVASMIGRFNDAIRIYRIEHLLAALPEESPYKTVDPASIKTLNTPPVNAPEFLDAVKACGVEYDPQKEEDAIDHAGTLVTKRASILLERFHLLDRARILTASKRNFNQNTDLLGIAFSTDFGNIQRMSLDCIDAQSVCSKCSIYDGMNQDGTPEPDSVWGHRSQILGNIWPDWVKAFNPDGVKPEDYLKTIYVTPTLKQFTTFWNENIRRAGIYSNKLCQSKAKQ
ncbi:MAG: hypothetical protein ACYC0V_03955 [Armatimonadota bacterium]